jgi:hypothetical protein
VSDDWLDEFARMMHDVLGGNPFYTLECARLALDTTRDPVGEPLMAVKFGVRDVLRTRRGVERTLESLTYAYIQHGDLAAATSAASQAAAIARDTGRAAEPGQSRPQPRHRTFLRRRARAHAGLLPGRAHDGGRHRGRAR